jgi:hypothetical protein
MTIDEPEVEPTEAEPEGEAAEGEDTEEPTEVP